MRSVLFAIVVSAAASGGCSPHKVTHNPKPPVELPDGYTGIEEGGANLPDTWWQDFSDPQLNQLVDDALQGNLQVRGAWERLRQAQFMATQAGAGRFPTVNLNGNLNRSEPANLFFPSNPLAIEAAYEVDFWKKYANTSAAAKLDGMAARDQVESIAMTLVSQISETWFQLISQRARLALLEEQIKVSENFLELAEMRLGQGLGSALDVLQQRRQLTAVAGQRPLLASSVAVLQNQLAVLIGKPPGAIQIAGNAKLPELPPRPGKGVPADLLLRRPDVRAAQKQVESADYRVAIAVANRLPSLRLSGNIGPFESFNSEPDLFALGPLWNLAAGVLMPIFQGGRLKAEVQRSESVVRERSYAFGQTLLQAILEVENALVQEKQQVAYIGELEGQYAVAKETLEEAQRRYRDGIGEDAFLQVLSALSNTQQIEQTLLTARMQALSYRIQLCRALGGTWTQTMEAPKDEQNSESNAEKTALNNTARNER